MFLPAIWIEKRYAIAVGRVGRIWECLEYVGSDFLLISPSPLLLVRRRSDDSHPRLNLRRVSVSFLSLIYLIKF
jgi:hypothetical protein